LEKYEPIDLGEVVLAVVEDKGPVNVKEGLVERKDVQVEEVLEGEAVLADVEGDKEKKPRCKTGTRRYKPLGPDCYTDEQIAAHKTRKRV
jgi:hypothetical protein